MDKLKKFDLMAKIVRELEDVRNSQQAVLEKIGKIEVDNIELGDKLIESKMPDIYQRTADNADSIREILESFQEKTEEYSEKNNIDKLREQEAINNVK
jgi:ATP-dependent Lon protease